MCSLLQIAIRYFVYGSLYVFRFMQNKICHFMRRVLPRSFKDIRGLARVHV